MRTQKTKKYKGNFLNANASLENAMGWAGGRTPVARPAIASYQL